MADSFMMNAHHIEERRNEKQKTEKGILSYDIVMTVLVLLFIGRVIF